MNVSQRNITACFTGHRVAAFAPPNDERLTVIVPKIMDLISQGISLAYIHGMRRFISGGAIGVDQWALEILINLKKTTFPDIEIIVAKPFPSQHVIWPIHVQEKFHRLCEQADQIVHVSEDPYIPAKMFIRNAWMVDNSKIIIAVKKDEATTGGTAGCLMYAQRKGLSIIHIEPTKETINFIEGSGYE